MHRLLGYSAILLVLLGATATAVVANTSSKVDPKGDTKGSPEGRGFDLKSARANDGGGGGTVVHRVESWKAAGPKAVVLELKTSSHPGGPDFTVLKPSDGGRAKVTDHRGKKVVNATYKKISATAFSLAFNLKFAGNPPKYRWRWRVYGAEATYDLLPNRSFVTHTVDYGGDDH